LASTWAEALGEAGADLVITPPGAGKAEKTAEVLREYLTDRRPGRWAWMVTDEAAVGSVFERVQQEYGPPRCTRMPTPAGRKLTGGSPDRH